MVDYVESLYAQATEAGAQADGQGAHEPHHRSDAVLRTDTRQISSSCETRLPLSTRRYRRRRNQ